MVLRFGTEEIKLKFSASAVEKIEDYYNKSIQDIFKDGEELNLKAKEVIFILYALTNDKLGFEEFKHKLSEYYTYSESIKLMTEAFKSGIDDPNAITDQNDIEKLQ